MMLRSAVMSLAMTVVGFTLAWICVGAFGQRGLFLSTALGVIIGTVAGYYVFRPTRRR